jgi:tetratricopeptide (TPR) repeat protein
MAFPKSRLAIEKALELDEDLASAHVALGYLKMHYEWDWKGAERAFKKAVEIKQNYSSAHYGNAVYLVAMGKNDEAIAEAIRARELDPIWINTGIAVAHIYALTRKYDQAIEEYRNVIEMDPNNIIAHAFLSWTYAQKKMLDEAIAQLQKTKELSEEILPQYKVILGRIYSKSGKIVEAENVLDELLKLSKVRYVSPWQIAIIYLGLGQKDQAIEWLEKAYEVRDHWLVYSKVDPGLDRIRSDPRFKELLKKIGLEK